MLTWCLTVVSFRGCICFVAVPRSILSLWAWFKIHRVYHCPFNGEVLVPQGRVGEAEYFYCPQSCSIYSLVQLCIPTEIYTVAFLIK